MRHRILVILWSALLVSQVIYLYGAHILRDDAKADAHARATLTLPLAVVSIAIAVFSDVGAPAVGARSVAPANPEHYRPPVL